MTLSWLRELYKGKSRDTLLDIIEKYRQENQGLRLDLNGVSEELRKLRESELETFGKNRELQDQLKAKDVDYSKTNAENIRLQNKVMKLERQLDTLLDILAQKK